MCIEQQFTAARCEVSKIHFSLQDINIMQRLNSDSEEFFSAIEDFDELIQQKAESLRARGMSQGSRDTPRPMPSITALPPKLHIKATTPACKLAVTQELTFARYFRPKVLTLTFSDDGHFLAVGSNLGIVLVYQVLLRCEVSQVFQPTPHKILREHCSAITALAWSVVARSQMVGEAMLLSASADHEIKVWLLSEDAPVVSFHHPCTVMTAIFDPLNNNIFYAGGQSRVLKTYSVESNPAQLPPDLLFPKDITCVKFTPDGRTLLVGMRKGLLAVCIREETGLTYLSTISCKNKRGLQSAGRRVINIDCCGPHSALVTTLDSRIRMINFMTGHVITKFKGHKFVHGPGGAWTLPESDLVVSGSDNGCISFWEYSDSHLIKVGVHTSYRVRHESRPATLVPAPPQLVEHLRQHVRFPQWMNFFALLVAGFSKSSLYVCFLYQ